MDDKSIEQITKLISDFRLLVTKVKKDNQAKARNLTETNQEVEALCNRCRCMQV